MTSNKDKNFETEEQANYASILISEYDDNNKLSNIEENHSEIMDIEEKIKEALRNDIRVYVE